MKGGCKVGRKEEPKGGCKIGKKKPKFNVKKADKIEVKKKPKFNVKKAEIKITTFKKKPKFNVKPAKPTVVKKKRKFNLKPAKLAEVKKIAKDKGRTLPTNEMYSSYGLTSAEANAMSPLKLFGLLAPELKQIILDPKITGVKVAKQNPIKPKYLKLLPKTVYMLYDTKKNKPLDVDDYVTADESQIMGTVWDFHGLNHHRTKEWLEIPHLREEAARAIPIQKRILAKFIKHIKFVEGKTILDNKKTTTKVSFDFGKQGGIKSYANSNWSVWNLKNNGKTWRVGDVGGSIEYLKDNFRYDHLFENDKNII